MYHWSEMLQVCQTQQHIYAKALWACLCWFLEAPCPRSVDGPAVSMQRKMGVFAVALRHQFSFSQHSLTIPIKGPATLLEFCQVGRCQL